MLLRLAFFAIIAALCVASESQAAILTYASGNTSPQANGITGIPPGTGVNGTVSYAVFSNGGTVGDTYGLGIAGIDTALLAGGFSLAQNYLYLYQVVNDAPTSQSPENDVPIVGLKVTTFAPIGSVGILHSHGFDDDGGLVGVGNPFGDFDDTFGNPDVPNTGVTGPAPWVGLITDGVDATTVSSSFFPFFGSGFFNAGYAGLIGGGQRAEIVGFTSMFGPALVEVNIIDGSTPTGTGVGPTTGTGFAPPILPEPASMAIWSLGLAMVGGVGAWRRRRLKAAA